MGTKMATEIDWNLIELTEIYEAYDIALRLLDEDFAKVRQLMDTAIQRGATAESMTKPIRKFAIELHVFCEAIDSLESKKKDKELSS